MISGDQRDTFEESLRCAPTLLEVSFWGWMLGYPGAQRIYFEELTITDLVGPGHLPDNFPGVA